MVIKHGRNHGHKLGHNHGYKRGYDHAYDRCVFLIVGLILYSPERTDITAVKPMLVPIHRASG